MKTILAFCFVAVTITTAVELPNNFRICKKSDPKYLECIAEASRDAVISMANGLKSFKILPLEPLAVDSVKIGESEGSVTLAQEYKNIKLHGLTKGLQIHNYKIDWDRLVFRSDAYNPQVDFVGDYKVNGKVLLLPVRGSGKSNITMYDLKTENIIYFEKYQKNGEDYLKVKNYVVKFSPDRVTLRFDNLFDGDSVLGEQMNRFINENSQLLFKELQAPYEETFGLVFARISNEIFSRVPMAKIFPNT